MHSGAHDRGLNKGVHKTSYTETDSGSYAAAHAHAHAPHGRTGRARMPLQRVARAA